MTELSEIIKYEQQAEKKVSQIRETVDKEIAEKKQAIEKKLAKSCFLTAKEKEKIEKQKQEKIRQIETNYQRKLEKALVLLKENSAKKLKKATSQLINVICPSS